MSRRSIQRRIVMAAASTVIGAGLVLSSATAASAAVTGTSTSCVNGQPTFSVNLLGGTPSSFAVLEVRYDNSATTARFVLSTDASGSTSWTVTPIPGATVANWTYRGPDDVVYGQGSFNLASICTVTPPPTAPKPGKSKANPGATPPYGNGNGNGPVNSNGRGNAYGRN